MQMPNLRNALISQFTSLKGLSMPKPSASQFQIKQAASNATNRQAMTPKNYRLYNKIKVPIKRKGFKGSLGIKTPPLPTSQGGLG